MLDKKNFYINGKWVSPLEGREFKVIDPSNEESCAKISLGGKKDIDNAVNVLTQFSYLIRKALSKKIDMKFLPKVYFVSDKSFDYAEKIERLINKNK